jgi:hypothetical protein
MQSSDRPGLSLSFWPGVSAFLESTPSMAKKPDPTERVRGLAAVQEIRENRKRGKYGRPTFKHAFVAFSLVGVLLGVYYFLWNRGVQTGRAKLLAAQADTVATLGKDWFPLRDRMEAIVKEAHNDFPGDEVLPAARSLGFRNEAGLYIRLRLAETGDVATAAEHSVKDGFTSCLVRGTGEAPATPPPPGPTIVGGDQPWNLRQAYRSTRVLTDGWRKLVEGVDDDLRLKVFEEQYEKAQKTEIPFALNVVKQAKYFLLLLDEDVPEARIVEPTSVGDAGAAKPRTTLNVDDLALVPHPVRIYLYDLNQKKMIAQVRRTSVGHVSLGPEVLSTNPEVANALHRQVNNCQLAHDFVEAVSPEVPTAPAPSATPSASAKAPAPR